MAKMAKWRRHTVEFKRQVVERMKTCENIGALARELKLQRKLLYTWKYQFEGRPEPRHANLGTTAEERKDKQLREEITRLKSVLAKKRWRTIFSEVPCAGSRKDARRAPRLAPRHLRQHPVVDARARHPKRGADVPTGERQPGQLLPAAERGGPGRGGDGPAGGHRGNRAGAPSSVRLPAGDGRTAPPRHGDQPQTRAADDAQRQPAGRAVPPVYSHSPRIPGTTAQCM